MGNVKGVGRMAGKTGSLKQTWDRADFGWKFLLAAVAATVLLLTLPPLTVPAIQTPLWQIAGFLLVLVVAGFGAYLLYRSVRTVFLLAQGKRLNSFDWFAVPALVVCVAAVLFSVLPGKP